jgi:hypothetical protein
MRTLQAEFQVLIEDADGVDEHTLSDEEHPLCHGYISRQDAERILRANDAVGGYLIRIRTADKQSYAFSLLGEKGCVHSKVDRVRHTVVGFLASSWGFPRTGSMRMGDAAGCLGVARRLGAAGCGWVWLGVTARFVDIAVCSSRLPIRSE